MNFFVELEKTVGEILAVTASMGYGAIHGTLNGLVAGIYGLLTGIKTSDGVDIVWYPLLCGSMFYSDAGEGTYEKDLMRGIRAGIRESNYHTYS